MSYRTIAGLIIAGLLLVAALCLRYCGRVAAPPPQGSTLAASELERIETTGRTISVTTHQGTEEHYVPDTATVIVGRDGHVDVQINHLGLDYELGGGIGVADGRRLKLMVDSRIVYAWRLSIHGGLTLDPLADKWINLARPLIFIACPVPLDFLPNTSIWAGHELPGDWVGGIRVRF